MAHLATAGSADPARLGHNTTTPTRRKKRDNTRDGAREGGTTGAFNSKNGRGDRKKSGRKTLRRDQVLQAARCILPPPNNGNTHHADINKEVDQKNRCAATTTVTSTPKMQHK